jgi:hypothetical protein
VTSLCPRYGGFVISARLLRRPDHLVMECSSGPARLSSVKDGYRLLTCRMLLSLCDFPDGWMFMSRMPSADSPSWITSFMSMVPSSPRSMWAGRP